MIPSGLVPSVILRHREVYIVPLYEWQVQVSYAQQITLQRESIFFKRKKKIKQSVKTRSIRIADTECCSR
jgi:hypothetical protein